MNIVCTYTAYAYRYGTDTFVQLIPGIGVVVRDVVEFVEGSVAVLADFIRAEDDEGEVLRQGVPEIDALADVHKSKPNDRNVAIPSIVYISAYEKIMTCL